MQTQVQVQTGQPGTTQQQQGEPISAGTRFEYEVSPYRDVIFSILFIAMIIGMIIYTIAEFAGTAIDDSVWFVVGMVFVFIFLGAFGGVCGLQVIKCIPETIIKLVLFSILGLYGIAGLVFLVQCGSCSIGFFVVALIIGIYMLIIWRRIPFAATLLWISARICSKYSGVLWVALTALILQILFYILWAFMIIGITNSDSGLSGGSVFALLVSLYWGMQVFINVSHTTTCGVAATWFFYKEPPPNVTSNSLKRTLTTSFGSVCFGSLIIAIIQALRAMVRMRGRHPCAIICALILCICERLIKFFTEFAFAYVAIYGQSFYVSAKMTFELLERRGWWAIINSAVINIAIFGGSLISGGVVCLIGFLIGLGYSSGTRAVLAVLGFLIGYFMAFVMLKPVKSAVVALFVCYAEDPEALKQNHLDEYTRLTNAEPKLVVVMVTQVMVVQQPMMGQPMMMQGQPMMMQGQPMMMQGQPMMMQGQPMMMQGQPMMTQGQMPPQ